MKRYISFYATREDAETTNAQALTVRKTQEVARKALVNVGGKTYPALQRAANWTYADEVDDGVSFTFNRQRPYGDIRFERDLSFTATREPMDDEFTQNVIFLEALTWEFVFTLQFFSKFVQAFGRPGKFRIGLGLAGFQGAQVDWAGFEEDSSSNEAGKLLNWRFMPPADVVNYEGPGVDFPTQNNALVDPIISIISDVSSAIKGIRHTAVGRRESQLVLSETSREKVVRDALTRLTP